MISKLKTNEVLTGKVKEKKVKRNGDRFLRAVKGFIILEISLEVGELLCVQFSDVR
jgi:hypothetical protein